MDFITEFAPLSHMPYWFSYFPGLIYIAKLALALVGSFKKFIDEIISK